MTQQIAKPTPINTSARCTHRYANGRRCRLYATSANPRFCPSHADLPHHRPDPAETAATQINDLLSRLLLLLAQDKISTRRAAVLTYITSQLLRTLPAIDKEGDGPAMLIYDAPRPCYDSSCPKRHASNHQDASSEATKAAHGVCP
jgi:hypothetical protein